MKNIAITLEYVNNSAILGYLQDVKCVMLHFTKNVIREINACLLISVIFAPENLISRVTGKYD
jgi:hypothetical protein